MTSQYDRAKAFHDLHTQPGCFLMPNAWDIGSARMLEAAGFRALATTSAGIAFSLGYPDHTFCGADAGLGRAPMLDRIGSMAASISLPLNADLEAGYGDNPEGVATTVRQAISCGAAGGNIEDYTSHRAAPLFDVATACARIRAARQAIDQSGIPFVLVARTDALLTGQAHAFAEAVQRANLYREAGADCLFIPGASDTPTIATLVKEVSGPLSVVMGLTGNSLSLAQLAELGVRRVSIGASLARALYYRIREAAQEMASRGTFSYADAQMAHDEINQLFESYSK